MVQERELKSLAQKILRTVCEAAGVAQAFIFDSKGDYFWSAREPVDQLHVGLLSEALDLAQLTERTKARPYLIHDPGGRFTLCAYSPRCDLYVFIVGGSDLAIAEMSLWPLKPILAHEIEVLASRMEAVV
ncbi:MAG: hypothetical protein HYV07_03335 [Deltaproteobacteria bacterium]|nr:hypothetical protein [Deltaproteobacteria bacterium]